MSGCHNPEIKTCKHNNITIDECFGCTWDKDISEIKNNLQHHWELNYSSDTNLSRRITKVEDYVRMEDRVTASDVLLRIIKLGDDLAIHQSNLKRKWDSNSELSKRLTELETEINTVRALGSRAFHPKKPYKCPVCYDEGFKLESKILAERKCPSCEGKGVLWG